jgi:tight adherence protein C
MELLTSLIRVEVIFTILVGFAAFGTVVTIAAPYFENDKLKSRIANVAIEREKLRAQQKAQFSGDGGRLRDKRQTGLFSQLVELLNLRKVFQAEESKDLLRQAGFRNDNQMTTFLALRVISPILLCVIVFVYSSTLFADKVPPTMRFVAAAIGLIVGYYLPMIVVKNYVQKRQQSIKRAWSDALDLLLICVESGMALEPALIRVSREIGSQSVPLAEELTLTVAELSYLQDRRKALDNLSKRTGLETVRSVVTSLIQSERYGTPLGTALRVLAQENRDARMSEAERKAAALPPKLTVPMILFFLPVIFVVILAPALILVLAPPAPPP